MNICTDVVDEILSRLPVKSLLRFKVVCKDWYLHIHSNSFIAKHIKNQRTNEKALIYLHNQRRKLDFAVSICREQEINDDEDYSRSLFLQDQQYCLKDMPLHYFRNYEDTIVKNDKMILYNELVQLIGTCNGLVCLDYKVWDMVKGTYYKIITLWNPATRDFKTLPSWEQQNSRKYRNWYGHSDHVGFAFDSTSNDYKVIRLMHCYQRNDLTVAVIYSLNTNSWRKLDYANVSGKRTNIANYDFATANTSTTAILGDIVYWAVLSFDLLRTQMLLSFDIGKEVFQLTPLPSKYMALVKQFPRGQTNLFTLRDSIALVRTTETTFAIWSTKDLEQGCASWIKMLNIDHVSGFPKPLGFWKCKNNKDDLFIFTNDYFGRDEMRCSYVKDRGEIIKNDRTMTMKVENDIVLHLNVFTYVETLVSVK